MHSPHIPSHFMSWILLAIGFAFAGALATVAAGVWYGYTGCRLLVDPGGAMIAVLTACLAGILSNALRAAGPARS